MSRADLAVGALPPCRAKQPGLTRYIERPVFGDIRPVENEMPRQV